MSAVVGRWGFIRRARQHRDSSGRRSLEGLGMPVWGPGQGRGRG